MFSLTFFYLFIFCLGCLLVALFYSFSKHFLDYCVCRYEYMNTVDKGTYFEKSERLDVHQIKVNAARATGK